MDYKSTAMDLVRRVRAFDKTMFGLDLFTSRASVNRDRPGDVGPYESFKPTTSGNPAEALFILENVLLLEIRKIVVSLKQALASSTETELYQREAILP